jgi:hypothetical protein
MKYILSTLLLLLLIGHQAHGKTLDDYLVLLEQHPRVQALLESSTSLKHQAKAAMGLPDPTLALGVDNLPVSDPAFDRYLPSSKVIGFTQGIPNSSSRKAKESLSLAQAKTKTLMAQYTISQLQAQFFTNLAELERIKQQRGYELQKIEIINQLRDYYDASVEEVLEACGVAFSLGGTMAGSKIAIVMQMLEENGLLPEPDDQ